MLMNEKNAPYFRPSAEDAARNCEEAYFHFFKNGPNVMLLIDPKTGSIIDASDAAVSFYGYPAEDLLHLKVMDINLMGPGSIMAEMERTSLTKQNYYDFQHRLANGQIRDVAVYSGPVHLGGRQLLLSVIFDQTEKKLYESRLIQSEDRLRRAEIISKSGNWELHLDSQTVVASDGAVRIYGGKKKALHYDAIKNIPLPEYRKILDTALKNLIEQDLPYDVEFKIQSRDTGQIKDIRSIAVLDRDKRIVLGVIRDITEQKAKDRSLRESEQRFERISRLSNDIAFSCVSDSNGSYSLDWMSGNTEKTTGYTIEEITVQSCWRFLVHPEDVPLFERHVTGLLPGQSASTELRLNKSTGETIWVKSYAECVRDEKTPSRLRLYGGLQDITGRKQVEEALRESEEKFRLTFSASPDSVNISQMPDGRYIDVNEGFTRLTGYTREDAIGKTSMDLNLWVNLADRQKIDQCLQKNHVAENMEVPFRRKDGSIITTLISCKAFFLKGIPHVIFITRDITERKLFQTKLQQNQKYEAIATLAGGIAHDFNNLLMGIQGRTSLILLDPALSGPVQKHARAIEESIRSASQLTGQMLGFARGGKYEVKPVDINELVLNSSTLFGRTKKEVQLHTKCRGSSLVVEADRGQIEQVLLNLYINACQAMPQAGGKIQIETGIVEPDNSFCLTHQLEPGPHIRISVTDTGSGMDETTRLKAFDPFFTTKDKGRGTGLGLASAYGIIKNHGGTITVYSEIGHGSTFNIYLPQSKKRSQSDAPTQQQLLTGKETLLLVDDEALIIEVCQEMLQNLGYHVLIARNGQEAVQAVDEMGNQMDLVILDMIMPGMDGGSCFDCIRQIRPNLPVILSSGYAINGRAHEILQRGCNGFIQKPYSIGELSQKIRTTLDDGKKPSP